MPKTAIINPKNGIKATLVCQKTVFVNKMPPIPDRLPAFAHVTATLTNTTRSDFNLQAPTPCDVNFWELYDSSNNLVQSEPHGMCPQHVVTASLPAGQTIRTDNVITLNGKLLESGETYTIKYKFWGYSSEASFTVAYAE